jgi:hypothetical protein
MNIGFHQTRLLVSFHLDTGNYMDLQENLFFTSALFGELRTMTGTDGISDPAALQVFLERFGKYVASGILHDGAFKLRIEQQQADGAWTILNLTETQCNKLIDEALKSEGCPWIERELIYDALQLFGWSAFDADRHAAAQGQTITAMNTAPPFAPAPNYA